MSSTAVEVVALALKRKSDGKYLLARRGPGQTGAGHWEFPGGKVEPGETQPHALVREIEEELGIQLQPAKLVFVARNDFQYPQKLIQLFLWLYEIENDPAVVLTEHDQFVWCTPSQMKQYQLSPGDVYFVDKLL